jgi:hypothetical protein
MPRVRCRPRAHRDIDFHLSAELPTSRRVSDRVADLAGQLSGRPVLDVEITAQLQGAQILGAALHDGDGGQDVAQRQLAPGEDRARGLERP